ncbi:hypothetical protein TNCV_765051 [Trichonephila clavipes]|nr:hypothetical protein TNCV_765051 [Trichonephila clavipes]
MGERAFDESLGWEVQGRNAICDGRGTLSIARAARLPLGGRVARASSEVAEVTGVLFLFGAPESAAAKETFGVTGLEGFLISGSLVVL